MGGVRGDFVSTNTVTWFFNQLHGGVATSFRYLVRSAETRTHMRTRLIPLISAAVLAAFAAEPAAASVYLGLDFGRSSVPPSGDPTLGFALGYSFSRSISIEAFTRILSFRPFGGLFGVDTSYYPDRHYGVAAVGTVPLSGGVGLFGRLGAGRTTMHADANSKADYYVTDPSLGAGLAYDFASRWSVKLSSTRFTKSKVTTKQLGLEFRF